jgi:hypothetical protein
MLRRPEAPHGCEPLKQTRERPREPLESKSSPDAEQPRQQQAEAESGRVHQQPFHDVPVTAGVDLSHAIRLVQVRERMLQKLEPLSPWPLASFPANAPTIRVHRCVGALLHDVDRASCRAAWDTVPRVSAA